MAGTVIQRLETTTTNEGCIIHNERHGTWADADKIAGHHVDRRKCYAIISGELHEKVEWSSHCTGCTEVPEMTRPPERGMGCHECGYTGRVRCGSWVPYSAPKRRAA